MAEEDQVKFNLEADLRAKMDSAFEEQGVSQKEGLTRLVKFLLSSSDDLWPLILGQVRGESAKAIAEMWLKRVANASPKPGRYGGGQQQKQ